MLNDQEELLVKHHRCSFIVVHKISFRLSVTFWPKAHVGLEEPGFKRVHATLQQCGLITHAIPVDNLGVSIPKEFIHMLYTTPAHQFPLGMVMPVERRAELLQWANSAKAFIIEDDYDSEFRYKGLPIPL